MEAAVEGESSVLKTCEHARAAVKDGLCMPAALAYASLGAAGAASHNSTRDFHTWTYGANGANAVPYNLWLNLENDEGFSTMPVPVLLICDFLSDLYYNGGEAWQKTLFSDRGEAELVEYWDRAMAVPWGKEHPH